ncbi:permease prefix domain 1-containing protein [Naasia sp. SYSU D00057]|uniref:permease prefix domain 1-containing protein n=1 Tax=Naasia sp. SYSU D00057 TaxID=2817380 RepID=UPI001B315DB4|nr:permease prefix domain 1-containing protein [Naasia sp. SYSU D00057]
MTTLTDRYVYAALRSLPEEKRADIDRELRASIEDAVDARVEEGVSPRDAEREVLTEFGDPGRLAAGYADRPLHLIGPALFLDWWRLLKLLLAVVLPVATAGVVLGQLIAQQPVGTIIGTAVTTLLSVTVHLGFWVTLVFAVLERTTGRQGFSEWTPDSLPELPAPGRMGFGEVIASAVFAVILGGLLIWQQVSSVFRDEGGRPIPLLDPELWSLWIPYLLALLVLEVVFAFVVWRHGRWTYGFAAVNVVTSLLFAVPALWLLFTEQLLNRAFFAEFGRDWLIEPGSVTVTITAFVIIGITLWDIVDAFLKARRAAHPVATPAAA